MRVADALRTAGMPTADAEILLSHVLCISRAALLCSKNRTLSADELESWSDYVSRHTGGEPISYLTGYKEFYGRDFLVRPGVLIPRPSTEGLIEAAMNFIKNHRDESIEVDSNIIVVCKHLKDLSGIETIVDIGTGCGCIGITLALELPAYTVIATDISQSALEVAGENAAKMGVRNIEFRQGDLLNPIMDLDCPFLLVSNPPYVPSSTRLPREVADFEPPEALYAGESGSEIVRDLVNAAEAHPLCTGFCIEMSNEVLHILNEH